MLIIAVVLIVLAMQLFLFYSSKPLHSSARTLTFPVILIIVALLIFGIIFFFSKANDKLLPKEEGKVPVYQEKCFANFYCKKWYNRRSSKYPITRFTLYNEFVVVRCIGLPSTTFLLRYPEIDKVELGEIEFGLQKLTIYYHQSGTDDYMSLWLRDAKQAKQIIGKHFRTVSG